MNLFNDSIGWVTGRIPDTLLGVVAANGLLEVTFVDSAGLLAKVGAVIGFAAVSSLLLGKGMKYHFNGLEMYLWQHAYELPESRHFGANFGLTLAIWDYLFKTAYIPHDGQNLRLGFPGVEAFPHGVAAQARHGFTKDGKG